MGTKKYLVKLTPHHKFFFGGEQTFGQKTDDTETKNYFVKSNYFPQQTALLGLVRYQLLAQGGEEIFKNNKIVNNEKAIDLIGEKSFAIGDGFNFKKIHEISPIFIANNTDYFFPANKEYQIDTKLNEECKEGKVGPILEIELGENPLLKGYKPKYDFPDLLINKTLQKLQYHEVFVEKRQVGISKNYEGKTDKEAFYIQFFYCFKETYSFAFIVELEDDVAFKSNDLVVLGGEQQTFKMDVSEFSEDFKSLIPNYEKSKNTDKIVLVSDTLVDDNSILDTCNFAVTETIDFRFLVTTTDKNINYYNKPNKSIKYNLFKKGSVFYGNIDKVEKLLKNDQLNKIGYNIYKKIKK